MSTHDNNRSRRNIYFHIDDIPVDEGSRNFDVIELEDFLDPSISDIKIKRYSNREIKRAGHNLRNNAGDLKKSTEAIISYRQEHHKPLETITNLIKKYCHRNHVECKAYRRLKRIPTIIDKLQRQTLDGKEFGGMCITRMQDIAGCRFVFGTLDDLNLARQGLESCSRLYQRIEHIKTLDYILNPKINDCGYRSVHLLYRYRSRDNRRYQVEVQFRTELQNIWATAVEIIDIINDTKVKNTSFYRDTEKEVGQIKWEELLELMSDYIVHIEGVSTLCSSSLNAISKRLYELDTELNFIKIMSAFKMVGAEKNLLEPSIAQPDLYILFLVDTQNKKVEYAKKFDSEVYAIAYYNFLESTYTGNQDYNALLLSTEDVASLKTSYPNYVGSCDDFLRLVEQAMR